MRLCALFILLIVILSSCTKTIYIMPDLSLPDLKVVEECNTDNCQDLKDCVLFYEYQIEVYNDFKEAL